MGYIPSQGVWDEFYWTASSVKDIEQVGDEWTYRLNADSIDETVLADVDPCAGWMVGVEPPSSSAECPGAGGCTSGDTIAGYGLLPGRTVATSNPVGPVFTPDEVPLELLCETIPFAR